MISGPFENLFLAIVALLTIFGHFHFHQTSIDQVRFILGFQMLVTLDWRLLSNCGTFDDFSAIFTFNTLVLIRSGLH